jgi:hypothetical protein
MSKSKVRGGACAPRIFNQFAIAAFMVLACPLNSLAIIPAIPMEPNSLPNVSLPGMAATVPSLQSNPAASLAKPLTPFSGNPDDPDCTNLDLSNAKLQVLSVVSATYPKGFPIGRIEAEITTTRSENRKRFCVLKQILSDHTLSAYWEYSVYFLGLLGEPDSATLLFDFLRRAKAPTGEFRESLPIVGDIEYYAKRAVPTALGYLLHSTPSGPARDSVRNALVSFMLECREFQRGFVDWIDSSRRSHQELVFNLVLDTIAGCGLAGDVEMETHLAAWQKAHYDATKLLTSPKISYKSGVVLQAHQLRQVERSFVKALSQSKQMRSELKTLAAYYAYQPKH